MQPLRDLQKPGVSSCKGRTVLGEACRALGAGTISSWAPSLPCIVSSEKGPESGGWPEPHSALGLGELPVEVILSWERPGSFRTWEGEEELPRLVLHEW